MPKRSKKKELEKKLNKFKKKGSSGEVKELEEKKKGKGRRKAGKMEEKIPKEVREVKKKLKEGDLLSLGIPMEKAAKYDSINKLWNIAKKLEKGESWKKHIEDLQWLHKRRYGPKVPEEVIKNKLEKYGGEKAVKEFEKAKKKAPELLEKQPVEVQAEKIEKLFEGADRVVAPERAREKAEEIQEKYPGKEIGGKLRAHRVEKDGEKVVVLVPKYREKYTKQLSEEGFEGEKITKITEEGPVEEEKPKATPTEELSKELPTPSERDQNWAEELEERREKLEEGTIGIAHTHPPGPEEKTKLSRRGAGDEEGIKLHKTANLVVRPDKEKGEVGYPRKKGKETEVEKKEVELVPKEEIGKLLGDIPEKRAKEKDLPKLKKKKKE